MKALIILLLITTNLFAQRVQTEDKEDYNLYLQYCNELVPDTVTCYGHGEYHHRTVVKNDIVRPGLDTIKAGTVNYFFTKFVWYKCDCNDYRENDPKVPVIYVDLSDTSDVVNITTIKIRTLPKLPKNAVRVTREKVCQIPRRKASAEDYYAIRKSFQYLAWKDINKSLIFNNR